MERERKRLLIFAHYYPPDTASTGQMLKDLAEGMLDRFDVTVICAVPSYGGKVAPEYQTQRYYFEERHGVKIIRVQVPEFYKADKGSRVRNIVGYFFGALGAAGKTGKQDYVLTVSQPPVLGGLLGVIGKRRKHAKMIYCIQDFNPEQVMAVHYCFSKTVLKAMMAADQLSCERSDLIITVGRDLVETLENRFGGKNVPRHVMINNWTDERKIYPLEMEDVLAFRKRYGLEDRFVFMYSGNIGLYYDLENLLRVIERILPGTKAADGREVAFAFVGAGAVLDKLISYKNGHHMDNVVFIPYQDEENLIYSLNAADVHWVVNAKGIKGVSCPSKFYGCVAAARPILGVLEKSSEIRMLIEEAGCGLVCEPEAYDKVEENIRWFLNHAGSEKVREMGQKGRAYLEKNLTKGISIQKYKDAILALEEKNEDRSDKYFSL